MTGGGFVGSRGPVAAAATIPASYQIEHAKSASTRVVPTERERDPFQQAKYEYQDHIMGFAGERHYSTAVHPTQSSTMHTRQSSYVEYGGDEERR